MQRRWVVRAPDHDARRLAQEFEIHPSLAQVLLERGYRDSASIRKFLNPSFENLENPFAFEHMAKAVERIRQAILSKEKILVYGDYDVDGVTASAILGPVLKKLGADVDVHLPHRVDDGYGLNIQTLEKLLKKKYSLLITADNGISSIEPISFLNQKGVHTIIVDHHTPKGELPAAYAILCAFAGEKKGDRNLAACGLAWKLAWALTEDLESVKPYLDLVVVGTIADIAPVLGDNRILLKHGLPVLSNTRRPGLLALMKNARIDKKNIGTRDIAFGLGPRINASGRMGSPEIAYRLLTTENPLEAENLAQVLEEGNRERQRVEAAAFEEAVERVETEGMKDSDRVLVLESQNWHEGVLGIVAARLVERYKRPSIVIALKDAVGKGSGRSVPEFSIFQTVRECENLLVTFGGHAQACGLTIEKEKIMDFRKRLNETAAAHTAVLDGASTLHVDSELGLAELDLKFLQDLMKLSPFGPGNRKPLFVSRGLRLKNEAKKRGQDTLVCWVSDELGKTTCEMVGFRMYERFSKQNAKRLDIVYQPALKYFNGIVSIELQLEDWAASGL